MCILSPRAPRHCFPQWGQRPAGEGCGVPPPSTPLGPLREGSSEEEPRILLVVRSVTASYLVQLVRLHEIGAGLSASSACGAATWPHRENPGVTGFGVLSLRLPPPDAGWRRPRRTLGRAPSRGPATTPVVTRRLFLFGFSISFRHVTPADCSLFYPRKEIIDTGTSGRWTASLWRVEALCWRRRPKAMLFTSPQEGEAIQLRS